VTITVAFSSTPVSPSIVEYAAMMGIVTPSSMLMALVGVARRMNNVIASTNLILLDRVSGKLSFMDSIDLSVWCG
jgi:hypothetical protein